MFTKATILLLTALSSTMATTLATVTQKAYLDITKNGKPVERIVVGLFGDVVPKTVANFAELCTMDKFKKSSEDTPLRYVGTPIHRIVKGFMMHGGDNTHKNG